MKIKLLTILSLISLCVHSHAQILIEEHLDIYFTFDANTSEWDANLRSGSFENPDVQTPLDQGSIPARDLVFPTGNRIDLPASGFEFTGVDGGDPIWLLPQDNTNYSYTWPGIRNSVTPGTFRSYSITDDSRVPTSSQTWITYALKSVTYAGQSQQSTHFSAWQNQSGTLTWMSTFDGGITDDDVFYHTENGHSHLNFGFSDLGIYRVGLEASAVLDSNGQTVTSNTEFVTFAIGTLATWLADHFGGTDLVDAQVTGMDADDEGDGLVISQEYAFNLNPTVLDRHYLTRDTGTSGLPIGWVENASGADRLHVQYLRRKSETNPQIEYIVEFNDDLSNEQGWVAAGTQNTASIDSTWERVTVTDTESVTSKSNRFVRVRIVVQESITY